MNFESEVNFDCAKRVPPVTKLTIGYPFRFGDNVCPKASGAQLNSTFYLSGDVSSDAQFFVATGVLSILYCIFIVAVYTVIDEIYKSKSEIPLAVSRTEKKNNNIGKWPTNKLKIILIFVRTGFYVDNNFGHFLVGWIGCMVKWCRCIENAHRSRQFGKNLLRM